MFQIPGRTALPRGLLLRWLGWFMLANIGLLLLLSTQYFTNATLPETLRGRIFLGLALPGHFALLAIFPYLPVFALAVLYPRRRPAVALAVSGYALLLLVVALDTRVFALYRFHLNGMVLNLLTGGAATQILPFSWVTLILAAMAVVTVVAAEWWLARLVWRWVAYRPRRAGWAVCTGMLLILFGGQGQHAWADARQDRAVTRYVRYLPWPQMARMDEYFDRWGWIEKQQRTALTLPGDSGTGLRYPLETVTCQRPKRPLNLVMIAIDGWRFDALGPEVTPNTWRLAQRSWRFADHYSAGNASRFGIFGLFYGLYASYWHSVLAERKGALLVDELARQRYRMGIFGSASLASPEFDRTVFSSVRHLVDLRTEGNDPPERDETITRKFIRFLDQPGAEPFFSFLFYDSPHSFEFPEDYPAPFHPWWRVVNYLVLNNDSDPVPFRNRYKNSVHFVDSLIGKLLVALEARNLLDSTVILLTGDHGEEFNDNGLNYWGHNGNFSRYQAQVPLVLYWPGKAPQVYRHRTSHLDVAPTLMRDLLGCSTPAGQYSHGRHLLDTAQRPYLVIGSWHSVGILQENRITVFNNLGQMDILDPRYREIPGARPDPEIMGDVMRGMARFFAR